MAEPAPTVVDAQTGEVLVFTGPTVPAASYRELEAAATEQADELEAIRRDRAAAERKIRALQKEIDDLMDQSADRDTVRKCLEYWRDKTGRGKKTRIDLASGRAKHVRWALRHWEPREFCLMVLGMLDNEWYQEHPEATDVKHLLQTKAVYDEAKAERFLAAGRKVLG